jgi:hypothetical protein
VKTFYSKAIRLNRGTTQLILFRRKGQAHYRLATSDRRITRNQHEDQQIYSSDAADHVSVDRSHLSAYFLYLRSTLDWKPHSALIVDLASGYILSLNLPAFELLKINAVGFRMTDFAIDKQTYQQVCQQLHQTKKFHGTLWLRNADGHQMETQVDAEVKLCYLEWVIFYFNANH